MLVQCPTCQHTHKSVGKGKRYHCTECGTLWDNSGRVVTGRNFPKNKPTQASRAKAQSARKGAEKDEKPRRRFWDVEVL